MSLAVRLSPAARDDLRRLADFLALKSPKAARMALEAIAAGVTSLDTHADRGRRVGDSLREIRVGFGRDGYVVRYRVDPDVVFVARIFHAREVRS